MILGKVLKHKAFDKLIEELLLLLYCRLSSYFLYVRLSVYIHFCFSQKLSPCWFVILIPFCLNTPKIGLLVLQVCSGWPAELPRPPCASTSLTQFMMSVRAGSCSYRRRRALISWRLTPAADEIIKRPANPSGSFAYTVHDTLRWDVFAYNDWYQIKFFAMVSFQAHFSGSSTYWT